MSAENKPFVKAIYISHEQGGTMISVTEVKAMQGRGLEDDRYEAGRGFWQTVKNPRPVKRDVSLILASNIRDSNFEERETRRNLVIEGTLDFNDMVGREFQIGEVVFKGSEICTPCKRPSQLSGKEGFEKEFKAEKGGLRAEILTS